LGEFNRTYGKDGFTEEYPYVLTEEIEVKGLETKSGRGFSVSGNMSMFGNVTVLV
jgi:hypothetical protein